MFSDVWSENVGNVALFERLKEIHSNPPILYYGFNFNFIMHQKPGFSAQNFHTKKSPPWEGDTPSHTIPLGAQYITETPPPHPFVLYSYKEQLLWKPVYNRQPETI